MAHHSSHCENVDTVSQPNPLGLIFRGFGEAYISQYAPPYAHIKLIKNIRKCRTPAMGAMVKTCDDCGAHTPIYKSCGDSKCPICQGFKRVISREKISAKLLAVPYVHTIFTLPHELNSLLKANPKKLYDLLYHSAWKSIKKLSACPKNIGAQPGMIALMHTWGSDMKYHVHLHTLITFGGIDDEGNWQYPKRKDRLAKYGDMCKEFRAHYLAGIRRLLSKGELKEVPFLEDILNDVAKKRWVIHNTEPQIDTQIMEEYLARYILRIAVSNSRISFDEAKQKVELIYNNYRLQEQGQPAPKAIKIFDPLSFIHQFMQHLPPANFHRLRYYGLHSSRTYKKIKDQIPAQLKRNGDTVKKVFQLLKALLGLSPMSCKKCEGTNFTPSVLSPDMLWLNKHVVGYTPKQKAEKGRSPPNVGQHIAPILK